jgi:DNA polymerase-3 subunit gamma/tau
MAPTRETMAPTRETMAPTRETMAPTREGMASAPAPASAPVPSSSSSSSAAIDADSWPDLVAQCALSGPAKELAAHAGFVGYADGILRLSLPPADEHLQAPGLVKRLADALAKHIGSAPQIRFETAQAAGETLHQRTARERDARQVAAEHAFLADPDVQRLMQRHGATVVPDSIRPFDEA